MSARKSSPSGFNRLSDRDMIFDLLQTEKNMSHLYNHAVLESADERVRDNFIALQQDEQEAARMLFDFMQQRGWYSTGGGRQKAQRYIHEQQRLSGGSQRADSRYAASRGGNRFGQNLSGRRQPQGQGQNARGGPGRQEQYSGQPEWNF